MQWLRSGAERWLSSAKERWLSSAKERWLSSAKERWVLTAMVFALVGYLIWGPGVFRLATFLMVNFWLVVGGCCVVWAAMAGLSSVSNFEARVQRGESS